MTAVRTVAVVAVSLLAGFVLPRAGVPWDLAPDLPLIAVLMVAAERGIEESMLLAAAAGLVTGVFSAAPIGTHAIVLVVLAYLCRRFTGRVSVAALPVRALLLGGGSIAAAVLDRVVARLVNGVDLVAPGGPLVAQAVATTVVGLLVWRGWRGGREALA